MSELALKLIKENRRQYEAGDPACKILDIGCCGLREIPKEVFELVWLEELVVSNEWWELEDRKWIKKVSLNDGRRNKLSKIPNMLLRLVNLKTLLINAEAGKRWNIKLIKNLPEGLNKLDIRNNQIRRLENIPKSLTQLYIGGNQITHLENLPAGLIQLEIRNNKIGQIENLPKSLLQLDISNNQITNLKNLPSGLTILDINSNQINRLENLPLGLSQFDISQNRINRLENLPNQLTHLNILGNQISRLENLPLGLRQLILVGNKITLIENLPKSLKRIDIRINKIEDLTPLKDWILNEGYKVIEDSPPKDNEIAVGSNPLTTPPPEIVRQGNDAVVNWFKQMEEGSAPLFEAKLMILGQGSSGKTTLTNLLLDEKYKVVKGKIDSTLGVIIHKGRPFEHTKIASQEIKAHLWDFGGQDIQKMLHQFFITENCLYVLLSDKRAENARFDYWFQIITLLGPQSRVIVLENPIDIKSANKDFPLNHYRATYKGLKIDCTEVDLSQTLTQYATKWKLLKEQTQEALSDLSIVNRPVPLKWTFIRNELEKLKPRKYHTKDEFYDICQSPGIGMSKEDGDLCLFYLKLIGDLEYFDDKDLCSYIFIDHNWMIKGMYYILADISIKKSNGRFTRKQAYAKWEEFGYLESEKAMLLRLLLKDQFDICYEIGHNTDIFITPLLLPNDQPNVWPYQSDLHFRYDYEFFPFGMFSRLIVRLHEKIDGEQRWETGVRLVEQYDGEEAHAEIQIFGGEDNKSIDIRINGEPEGCKMLLSFIRTELEKLHKDFKNLKFKRIVACNCTNCINLVKKGEVPSFYDFDKLQDKLKNRKYFEECPNSQYKGINIGQILSDVIIENAAKDNIDSRLINELKNMGMSINQIKNEQSIQMSDFGKATATSSSNSSATASATNEVTITINNLLAETENLKEDIERELRIKKVPEEEIELAKSDIEVFEKAIKEAEPASKENRELPPKVKSRLERFRDDIMDENSSIRKTLKLLRKGKDYAVKIAEIYNNIPGVPSIPPLALDAIKKL